MVLERLFPADWLERKPYYAFIIGFAYSVLGIFVAKLLFPQDPALVAVAFISVLLLPQLRKLFSIEERQERREKKFSWGRLWNDDKDVVLVYLSLFLGVFFAYALLTVWLPSFSVNSLFQQQLAYRGAVGDAASGGLFMKLLANNVYVLLAIFFFGVLVGDGAVFLITWNASVWGTIFAATARDASGVFGLGSLGLLALVLLIVLPHMILEALSYITGAVSGSLISVDVEEEKFESARFMRVFRYNVGLLVVAFVFLLLGVLVETWVLNNVDLYQTIIQASLG